MTELAKRWLIIEFLLLCVALPSAVLIFHLAPFMFVFLWGTALYGYIVLNIQHRHVFDSIWRLREITRERMFKIILPRWALACFAMTGFIYLYDPERMFFLLTENPKLVFMIMFLYPVFSALPQEFIFCTFFFERYKALFQTERARIIGSACVFAYAHMLFINWVAPFLGLIAGLIFALTYSKTRSLALVTLEHALYGNFLFLVGLGWYFYSGATIH